MAKFKNDLIGKLLRVGKAAKEMKSAIDSLIKEFPTHVAWISSEDDRIKIIDDPKAERIQGNKNRRGVPWKRF